MYIPPFIITDEITSLIADIAEKVGHLSATAEHLPAPHLRKENRIKTIQSSLAIENNSLTVDQVTAILEGKRVLGPPDEIQEVKNAIEAYELLLELNPYKEKDLLKAHKLMMTDLVKENGRYRQGGVGVFDGQKCIHMAPPAQRVPLLMADLLEWVKKTKAHPLVSSCVFHYEFEFIHPFEDGNGRMGRLWQTVILKDWKKIFAWLPVETMIKEHQSDYYEALNVSDTSADSTAFIEFMLDLFRNAIDESIKAQESKKVTAKVTAKVTVNQKKIMQAIKKNPHITQEELSEKVGISVKNIKENMKKMQEQNLIRRVGADKNGHWEVVG
jgi:Fic family protein